MSAEVRQALADAVSSVPDINCTPYYRQSMRSGDACVRLAASNRANFGRINTWQIWLVIPQDMGQAERWLDEHIDALCAALDPEFIQGVQSVTPSELILGAVSANGVVIEGAREG